MAESPASETKPEPKPTARTTPKGTKPKSSGHRYFNKLVSHATSTQANRTILLCVGGAMGIVLIAKVAGTPGATKLKNPTEVLRIGIGAGASVVGLMLFAEVSPEVAIGFAYLILAGALFSYGVDFASAIIKGTSKPTVPQHTSLKGSSFSVPNPTTPPAIRDLVFNDPSSSPFVTQPGQRYIA